MSSDDFSMPGDIESALSSLEAEISKNSMLEGDNNNNVNNE